MNAIKLLDSPIAFHRCLAELTGSAAAGLLLSQAIYWHNRCPREEGWWWKMADEWRAETYLGPKEFQTAKRACAKFLESEVRGMPAKTWYRLRVNELQTALERLPDGENKFSRNGETGSAETAKLDLPKRQIHSTENTSETTSEKEPRARRGKPEPTNEAKIAVAEFGTAYREHFGVPYGAGPRDAKWAQTLIAFGATPQEVASVARRAWKANGWFGKQATSLERLAARWNEVRAEMAKDSEPVNECGETAFEEIARVSEEEWQASNQRKATA